MPALLTFNCPSLQANHKSLQAPFIQKIFDCLAAITKNDHKQHSSNKTPMQISVNLPKKASKIALRNIITRNNKNESEPPRCCNDDVRPGREVLALVDHVLAADDDANVEIHRLADDFELDKKM